MRRLTDPELRQETLAGVTTFVTMAYIIIVNPAILEAAGIPREASVTATILAAALGTLMMGLYAKRPFAVAPLMGENAFIAFTVVNLDLLGREVATLVNEMKAPGRYQVTFDGSGLASGFYVCRLTAGSSVRSRKMLLLR